MRFIRLGAFLAWGAIASFAVAGFAAFNPDTAAVQPPPSTTTIAVAQPEMSLDTGSLAGRVAAASFASVTTIAPARALGSDADLLTAASRATVSTTSPETTTTIEPTPTTVAPTAPTTAPTTTVVSSTTTPDTSATTVPAEETATTTTTAAPDSGLVIPPGTEGWVPLVQAYFAPGDVEKALKVMWCESRGNPNATNPSSSASGLFQHLPKFWEERSTKAGLAGANIYDPTANTAVAAWLVYSGGGWKHWNPSAYCWS